jgi:hypothetical protein
MITNDILPRAIHDMLVTRNFDVRSVDSATGQTPLDEQGNIDFGQVDLMIFQYIGPSGKNYGTVTIVLDNGNLQMFFGDRFAKAMEPEDKKDWFGTSNSPGFLEQLKKMSVRHNFSTFQVSNPSKLKYTRQGISAIKKGLLEESFAGNRKVSYSGDPQSARLMIRHSKPMMPQQARHLNIESLFIETVDGERFRLPFKKLSGGRAMLEHVRQGGRPWDLKGQHIQEMVEQINLLAHFRRASRNRIFETQAQNLIQAADQHYQTLQKNLKNISSGRGYQQYFESWSAADTDDSEIMVEDIKSLFIEQVIDPRIVNALPILSRITKMVNEADEFEKWANNVVDKTDLDTRGQQQELEDLMQQPLIVGPDGIDASEQLYDLLNDETLSEIIKDYAESAGPEANAWDSPAVLDRLQELGINYSSDTQVDEAFPALVGLVARAAAPAIARSKVNSLLGRDEDDQEDEDQDTLERIKYLARK